MGGVSRQRVVNVGGLSSLHSWPVDSHGEARKNDNDVQ